MFKKHWQTDGEKREAIRKIVEAQRILRELSHDNQVPQALRYALGGAVDSLHHAIIGACDIAVAPARIKVEG